MKTTQNYGLVSIITPTYNCAAFIAQTIKSVLAQTYPYWEMIIVDDCSTDITCEIVKRYLRSEKRISMVRVDENIGAAMARMKAMSMAKGRWMAFLDSDDLWMPRKLERQLAFMVENDYHFTYTQYTETNEHTHDLGRLVTGPSRITRKGMYRYCWPGCLTVMYDAEYVGPIQIPDIRKNNDYAMWLQVIKKSDCFLLPEPLSRYRQRQGSISSQSVLSLIEWHFRLFRDMNYSVGKSLFYTFRNMIFGVSKKLFYVKKL